MKKLAFAALAITAVLSLSGCTASTPYGVCIGALDVPNPDLQYKVDTTNVAMAVIFSETIVVPVVVVASQLQCPVGVKHQAAK